MTILSVAYIGLISSPVILVVVCIGLIAFCCCKYQMSSWIKTMS